MSQIFTVGLTGQTGAGKSAVSALLQKEGFAVIDCDKVSRSVTEKGSPALSALTDAFSAKILMPDGTLNRHALGRLVFSNPDALALLNRTIFPFIIAHVEKLRLAFADAGETLVILDAPTLFESGADALCNYIVGVCASTSCRMKRIMARDGLTEAEARARIESQHSDAFFRTHCHTVIDNGGSREMLILAVRALADRILEVKNGCPHS